MGRWIIAGHWQECNCVHRSSIRARPVAARGQSRRASIQARLKRGRGQSTCCCAGRSLACFLSLETLCSFIFLLLSPSDVTVLSCSAFSATVSTTADVADAQAEKRQKTEGESERRDEESRGKARASFLFFHRRWLLAARLLSHPGHSSDKLDSFPLFLRRRGAIRRSVAAGL